uniref:UvrABC system protein B n=1 Tax=Biomphalaria glabrata TaxID=6526 RepID=A0A2C9JR44_BIOGL
MSRKKTLIDFGFRLPSAAHNRPLTFDEFMGVLKKLICVSATPGDYELNLVDNKFVEQIIRPTGLLDPVIKVKNKGNQLEDALKEIKARIAKNERVFLLTLTKKLAEELSEYLITNKIKSHYLHSELKTLERLVILNDLRKGKYDCVVGINLIREGIDLPEVSLVLIFDADKEGFLRNEKSLIQTIGRAARNINGTVILYADKMTESMSNAINETNRRRKIQEKYNIENGIVPRTIIKKISTLEHVEQSQSATIKKYLTHEKISTKSIDQLIATLKNDMKQAAKELKFEEAANLRDVILELETNINPTSEDLVEITQQIFDFGSIFNIPKKAALLSFSTNGSAKSLEVEKVQKAVSLLKETSISDNIEGEMQFDAAFDLATRKKKFPTSKMEGKINIFVFPDLNAGNIGYKIAQQLGGFLALGPVLVGLRRPISDLSRGAT